MNSLGQAALEYLLLLGAAVMLAAVAISLIAGVGELGTNTAEFGENKINEGFNTLQAGFGGGGSGDTTPPTIIITSPIDAATISNTIGISVNYSNDEATQKVEFFVDNTKVGEETISPYTFSWNTNTTTNGLHSLTAKIIDATGDTATSPQINITINNIVIACPSGNSCTTAQNCPGACDADNVSCNDTALDNCPDIIAPSAVIDLSATSAAENSVALQWTATGDDGSAGTASSYDVRYSTSIITELNWNSAAQAIGEPIPLISGSTQTFIVIGLTSNTNYFFAIKSIDDASNISLISNIATKTTDYSYRFLQMTDTHLLKGAVCTPNVSVDGRTDCVQNLINYTLGCNSGACKWIDPVGGYSIAPTIALQDAIPIANSLNPDFVVITGDLASYGGCTQAKVDAFNLVKSIADNLSSPYYVLGANFHDEIDMQACRDLYLANFGANSLNWNFSDKDNLFVGLSEVNGDLNNKFDAAYLEGVLSDSANKNQNKKLFIFTHTGFDCYDDATVFDACNNPTDILIDAVRAHKPEYRSIVIISGHNHSNVYELNQGIYNVTTTALMNYPTEFRVIDVTKNSIHIYMSPEVNPELSALSLEIINNEPGTVPPTAFYGSSTFPSPTASDRDITINLPPV